MIYLGLLTQILEDILMVNVEYINPFITATKSVIKEICNLDTQIGKLHITNTTFEGEQFLIIVGITGDLYGQVIISMSSDTACLLASHMMMGMPVPKLNDMATSAVSELSNMILGNTATLFSTKKIIIDITPPSVCVGEDMSITVSDSKTICIPLSFENGSIELNVAIREKK